MITIGYTDDVDDCSITLLDDLKVLRNGTLQNIALHSEVSYCK